MATSSVGVRDLAKSGQTLVASLAKRGVHRSPRIPASYSSDQDQDNNDDQYEAKSAAWIITPASRIGPRWQRADEQQDQNDDEYCPEHDTSSISPVLASLMTRKRRSRAKVPFLGTKRRYVIRRVWASLGGLPEPV